MKLYSIRDWNRHFETAQSRKVDGPLNWVAMPTKHDGLGYSRILSRADGPAVYGAWVVIVQVAAKCPKRGVLADENGPFCASDIALKTKFPIAAMETAINTLSSNQIGWLVVSEWEPNGSVLPLQYSTEHNTTGQDTTTGAAAAAGGPPEPPGSKPPPETPAAGPRKAARRPADQSRAEDLPVPPELDVDEFRATWCEWIAYRRGRRLTCRPDTMSAQLAELAPLGSLLATECLRKSIRNGWQGIFPEKMRSANGATGSVPIGAGQRHDPNVTESGPVKW